MGLIVVSLLIYFRSLSLLVLVKRLVLVCVLLIYFYAMTIHVPKLLRSICMIMKSTEPLSTFLWKHDWMFNSLRPSGAYLCHTLIIIGSNNGLLHGRRQAIILTNAGILLIWPWGTNFSEILIEIYIFSIRKMHLKMSSGSLQPSCVNDMWRSKILSYLPTS